MTSGAIPRGGRRVATRRLVGDFAVATALGVVLGLLGPFGSFFNGPVWQRVGYWTTMAWLGVAVFGLCGWLVPSLARARRTGFATLCAYTVISSAPLGGVSWLIATAIWPRLRRAPGLTPLVWYWESLAITALYVILFAVLERRRPDRAAPAVAPAPPSGLLGAAPSEVLCLQMEDHYVRIHTAAGSRLVLATMAQAVTALGRTPGLRVHRSWWVADKAVAAAAADGRNLRLTLTNGLSAPVARSSVAAVREAGWLRSADGERPLADERLFG